MGARTTQGIDEHRGKVRIRFPFRGNRVSITLEQSYSPANVKAARRLRAEVLQKIEFGIFRPAEYFPAWAAAHGFGTAGESATFAHYAKLFLASKRSGAASTYNAYEASVRVHLVGEFGDKPIASIRHSDVAAFVGSHPWGSNKTLNNALIPLRGAFKLARRDGATDRDPCEGIENLPHQAEEADPFTQEEADTIIAKEREKFGAMSADCREFAFYTGVRCPSELIELQWRDVDFEAHTLTVSRANVRGDLKDTKTHRSRVVDLNERAHAVLLRQKARTFLAGGYIFINDGDGGRTARGTFAGGTGKAFGSQVLLRRWTWVLEALGLRHRDAYQTRHSYASWLINAYVPDKLVAEQLGHSVIVLHKIYAKQLAAAKDDRKREKINEALFGPKVVPAINEKPLSF